MTRTGKASVDPVSGRVAFGLADKRSQLSGTVLVPFSFGARSRGISVTGLDRVTAPVGPACPASRAKGAGAALPATTSAFPADAAAARDPQRLTGCTPDSARDSVCPT